MFSIYNTKSLMTISTEFGFSILHPSLHFRNEFFGPQNLRLTDIILCVTCVTVALGVTQEGTTGWCYTGYNRLNGCTMLHNRYYYNESLLLTAVVCGKFGRWKPQLPTANLS